MKIDIRSADGNTFYALGKAKRLMRMSGCTKAYIDEVSRKVFNATSAEEARRIITEATHGVIEFYDSGLIEKEYL